jgi:hypothetical protein
MHEGDSHLGFITGATVSFWFMHSVVNLFKDDFAHRFLADYLLVHGPYIHANRDRVADEFLEAGRDWLFMVDNDMVFEPRDVWALYAVADEKGPGIYTAPYVTEEGVMTAGPWDSEREQVYHPLVLIPDRPTQVGVAGAGFTLVHREVYEAVGEHPYSALYAEAGEDVSFSWRAREAGYIPWLVPESKPGHHKTVVIYPTAEVRNMVGEDVNLVEVDGREGNRIAPMEV